MGCVKEMCLSWHKIAKMSYCTYQCFRGKTLYPLQPELFWDPNTYTVYNVQIVMDVVPGIFMYEICPGLIIRYNLFALELLFLLPIAPPLMHNLKSLTFNIYRVYIRAARCLNFGNQVPACNGLISTREINNQVLQCAISYNFLLQQQYLTINWLWSGWFITLRVDWCKPRILQEARISLFLIYTRFIYSELHSDLQ